jgi:hypothetical protein
VTHFIIVALLGLSGAFVNAATRLSAALYADDTPTSRQLARAWVQFWVSMFFGPVAAMAFAPWLAELFPHVKVYPAAVAVGLMANVLWPVIVEGVVPAFKKALGGWLSDLGASLSQGADD